MAKPGSTSADRAPGPRTLRERDDAVEPWLREEVATTYDAAAAEPDRPVSLASVHAELAARHAARLNGGR